MKRVVEGLGEVRTDSKKVTLEIRDFDTLAIEDKVRVELRKAFWNERTNPEVKEILETKPKGTKLAVAILLEDEATKLEKLSHL